MKQLFLLTVQDYLDGSIDSKQFADIYKDFWLKNRDDSLKGTLHFPKGAQFYVDAIHSACDVYSSDKGLRKAHPYLLDEAGLMREIEDLFVKWRVAMETNAQIYGP